MAWGCGSGSGSCWDVGGLPAAVGWAHLRRYMVCNVAAVAVLPGIFYRAQPVTRELWVPCVLQMGFGQFAVLLLVSALETYPTWLGIGWPSLTLQLTEGQWNRVHSRKLWAIHVNDLCLAPTLLYVKGKLSPRVACYLGILITSVYHATFRSEQSILLIKNFLTACLICTVLWSQTSLVSLLLQVQDISGGSHWSQVLSALSSGAQIIEFVQKVPARFYSSPTLHTAHRPVLHPQSYEL